MRVAALFDPQDGYVYFIGCAAMEAVKIGYSATNPRRRMRALQIGCPGRLELLEVMRGTIALEAQFHRAFAALRIGGEWFRHEGKLRDFLFYLDRTPGAHIPASLLWSAIADVIGGRSAMHSLEPLSGADYAASGTVVPFGLEVA